MRFFALASIGLLALAACATAHVGPSGPPSLTVAAGQTAPAQAQLYADCIAQAAANRSFDRENNWLRFHCASVPAQAFYDGLAAYSASIHSEIVGNGRTWRFTQRLEHDLSGVDYCWRDDAGGYGCTVVLNVGDYLAAPAP